MPPDLLFHRSNALYGVGDRILPGNWGRLVLGIGTGHPFFLREYVWEKVRQTSFPALPSRMNASYAFAHQARAETFTPSPQLPTYTYAVALADPASSTHRADMSWIDAVQAGYHSFESIERVVTQYWAGDEHTPDGWEWVIAGELVIRQRLTAIQGDGTH